MRFSKDDTPREYSHEREKHISIEGTFRPCSCMKVHEDPPPIPIPEMKHEKIKSEKPKRKSKKNNRASHKAAVQSLEA